MPLTGITIDAPETRDIDDGIWVELTQVENGEPVGWTLTVAIADVSAGVLVGSGVDQRAREQVASRYFATGNKPMLPRALAEKDFSLLPNETRKVILARIKIDKDGSAPKLDKIEPGEFHSLGRVNYDQVPGVLAAKDSNDETSTAIRTLASLAESLLNFRRDRGAFVLYDLNNGWVTSEEGYLKQLKDTRETIGYIIVQEAMILTNALVAEWCVKEDVPVLFRNHTARLAAPDRQDLVQQLKEATQGPWQGLDTVRQRIHMLLDRAEYGATLKGHFGLNVPAYLHFTSPIRRYADLVNHRQIKAKIQGEESPYTKEDLVVLAQHINEAEQAERESASEHFKGRAEDKAERALERGKLFRMNDKEFERALKVEIRSGSDARESLQEEFLTRLSEARLPHICMTVALFFGPENPPDVPQPGWKKIREAVLAHLVKKPEDAVTLWTMAMTIAEEDAPEYTEQRSGPPHATVFKAQARSGIFFTGWVTAKTAKLARQRASVALLHKLLNFPSPVFEEVTTETAKAPEQPAYLMTLTEGRDPIVGLQEYAQRNKLTLPTYSFKQEGPSHIPTITCTCCFNRRTGVGSASNKQEAKRRATKAIVDEFMKEHDWLLRMADKEEKAGGFPGESGRMNLQGFLASSARSDSKKD
jgi:ribonuclease R